MSYLKAIRAIVTQTADTTPIPPPLHAEPHYCPICAMCWCDCTNCGRAFCLCPTCPCEELTDHAFCEDHWNGLNL
jgi:hypothetical protein